MRRKARRKRQIRARRMKCSQEWRILHEYMLDRRLPSRAREGNVELVETISRFVYRVSPGRAHLSLRYGALSSVKSRKVSETDTRITRARGVNVVPSSSSSSSFSSSRAPPRRARDPLGRPGDISRSRNHFPISLEKGRRLRGLIERDRWKKGSRISDREFLVLTLLSARTDNTGRSAAVNARRKQQSKKRRSVVQRRRSHTLKRIFCWSS